MERNILHEAEHKLGAGNHLFNRTVKCDYREGVLVIAGRVPSFYLKQTAQSLLQGIPGVDRVENSLVVTNPYGVSRESATANC